ncbi:MAG: type II toxin-antitoxin system VapC family toxin [Luteolibacter sp.]|uniref:type II toxin-antitoxin system VapC family toxin n=1 Tax=Luteolibacter sp. TaxID=1962973 RepID=UPI00326617C9
MRGYLIDTNVLSEIRKGPRRAQTEVYQWWLGMKDQELFLSVMTLGEIRKGIDRLGSRDVSQTLALERWLNDVKQTFRERLIEVTLAVAEHWGRLQAVRSLPEVDALLAATALEHDLTLVTRNEADFGGLGIRILNPFLPPPVR